LLIQLQIIMLQLSESPIQLPGKVLQRWGIEIVHCAVTPSAFGFNNSVSSFAASASDTKTPHQAPTLQRSVHATHRRADTRRRLDSVTSAVVTAPLSGLE